MEGRCLVVIFVASPHSHYLSYKTLEGTTQATRYLEFFNGNDLVGILRVVGWWHFRSGYQRRIKRHEPSKDALSEMTAASGGARRWLSFSGWGDRPGGVQLIVLWHYLTTLNQVGPGSCLVCTSTWVHRPSFPLFFVRKNWTWWVPWKCCCLFMYTIYTHTLPFFRL